MTFDHPSRTPELRQLWKEAFGDSDVFLDRFFTTAFSAERCRIAALDGQLAAALYWLDCEYNGQKLAYIYAVATATDFRHRGLCHALMEDAHELLSQDYAGALLVPGTPALAPLYQELGYRWCSQIREFTCAAAGASVSLRPIDAEEFSRLRRKLLPPGSVLQEGAGLDFLAAQAEFYAGEHFLLAARKEGGTLYVPELLGDASAAPGILRTFGAEQGHFRVPGAGRQFAMYHPFVDFPPPKYFAFAFD